MISCIIASSISKGDMSGGDIDDAAEGGVGTVCGVVGKGTVEDGRASDHGDLSGRGDGGIRDPRGDGLDGISGREVREGWEEAPLA